MAPKEPLTLYYSRTVPGSDQRSGSYFQETGEINGIPSLKNISNRYMCKSDFTTPTTDIINFFEHRVPKNDNEGLPSTILDTVTIISKPYQRENSSNIISATANYIDSGSSSITTVDYVNYSVTTASGKFAGYKNIKIIYDKDKIRRTVIIS
jgi:hypothetical protein